MQTRRRSFTEACANTALGYAVALATQYAIFPVFGIHINHASHLGIAAVFTIVSVARNYLVRRLFNRWGKP